MMLRPINLGPDDLTKNIFIDQLGIKLGIDVDFVTKDGNSYLVHGRIPLMRGILAPLVEVRCGIRAFLFLLTGNPDEKRTVEALVREFFESEEQFKEMEK
jgi:hypothetical protein